MKRKLYIQVFLFFAPILLLYGLVEYAIREIPSSYQVISNYIDQDAQNIETLILGPSQILQAVNPALMQRPTLSLASGSQHHDSDFKILKQIKDRLPRLKTVVLEVSYSHFELPHNGPTFWKNSLYLEYYGVNNFERTTYFKDRLLFISHPKFFSTQLMNHYIKQKYKPMFNSYGFDENNYEGMFKNLDYHPDDIKKRKRFKINKEPNLELYAYNSEYFLGMLDYLQEQNLNVVVCTVPMYSTYLNQRDPGILSRRNDILQFIEKEYPQVSVFDKENDTLSFDERDFTNPSHMNPSGAKKFTKMLSEFLESAN